MTFLSGARGVKTWPSVPRRVAAAIIVVSGAACFVFYYADRVCDQQLSEAGRAVQVCRHMTITDPPIVLSGVVALLALTAFFNEISGFGFTLKRAVSEAARNSETALSEVQATRAVSNTAEQVAIQAARSASGVVPHVASAGADGELARQYDETRQSMSPGAARTAKLGSIVSTMIAAASVQPSGLDLRDGLASADDGVRVAAYAYAYAHTDAAPYVSAIVQALISEPTAFGQYWAIRALRNLVRQTPDALTIADRRALERFLRSLPEQEDRAVELRGVLA